MTRLIAGALAAILLASGLFVFFTSRAAEPVRLASAPPVSAAAPLVAIPSPAYRAPPLASPRSREEKRFARADKDDDGRITAAELFEPRRKAFAKLDTNGNGSLSFEEWAVRTVDKFAAADQDRSGWLTPAEYAATAPKPPKRKAVCSC
ncbi:EF-hand domain-containing protein [Sphingomonas astaxanthinifaciens]|uniref:EF-hand domain-containing protein n=1 Tax=Sphingomonas astaxanthinifaciens DSM 22298 TaxID=1123267 RepID=A0ABQ5Z346_9SPHN|nr:EF-hand domain-containing protein [Sphingomonas astaxanthinifaciens]GLR46384.1 hypothetical protein GCM10007925_00950 [Sphingomonas astaxanthinifaciens DSM 22298]